METYAYINVSLCWIGLCSIGFLVLILLIYSSSIYIRIICVAFLIWIFVFVFSIKTNTYIDPHPSLPPFNNDTGFQNGPHHYSLSDSIYNESITEDRSYMMSKAIDDYENKEIPVEMDERDCGKSGHPDDVERYPKNDQIIEKEEKREIKREIKEGIKEGKRKKWKKRNKERRDKKIKRYENNIDKKQDKKKKDQRREKDDYPCLNTEHPITRDNSCYYNEIKREWDKNNHTPPRKELPFPIRNRYR